jgi:group I intron endonuclease
MHYLVYQIMNVLNGKTYIGCHKTLDKDDGYMGSGTVLKQAVTKYGLDNFKKEILFEASSAEEMFTKEKELVVLGPQSYNLKSGGEGGFDFINRNRTPEDWRRLHSLGGKSARPFLGKRHTPQTIEICRQTAKDAWANGLMVNGFAGKHHSDESKKKIGAANAIANLGERNPNFGKIWITNPQTYENGQIKKTDPIPVGWIKGRKMKQTR